MFTLFYDNDETKDNLFIGIRYKRQNDNKKKVYNLNNQSIN